MPTRESFTAAQLESLRTEFAKIERVNPERLEDFRAIFAGCSDHALRQLVGARIRFVSLLAVNACTRRGIRAAA